MKLSTTAIVSLFALLLATPASPQATPAASPRPDVYHVLFAKAVPGSAAALGKALEAADPQATMPGHALVLRHQEGDDWDYCVIEHLGAKATVDAAPAPPDASRSLIAWHTDTFVAGPAWADFSKAMGLGADKKAGAIYTVAVWRALAGHREKLEEALTRVAPGDKTPPRSVLMQHLEGGPWNFLALQRHDSWQDFAASQTAGGPGGADGWSEVREHSVFHHDTLADRIAPK